MNPGAIRGLVLLAGLSQVEPGADRDPEVPLPSEASYGYLSTALLMDPCSVEIEDDWQDDDARRAIDEAREWLPEGTCSMPGMRELLFRTRLLQYTLIVESAEPWHVFDMVEAQRQAEALCGNVDCLRQHLMDAEERLQSMFGAAPGKSPRTSWFCDAPESVASDESRDLPGSIVTMLENQCVDGFTLQSCNGAPELLSATCPMGGISVNAPEWLWRPTATGITELLHSDEGPLLPLSGSCNGLPDVMTSARSNMGESHVTLYRYDGVRYQVVIAYIRESIGASAVARYPQRGVSVACD